MLSPLHRHNSGSVRDTSARVRIHCLLLSFSYPQDMNLLYPTPPREEWCLQAMFLSWNLFLSWFFLQWNRLSRPGSHLSCGWQDKFQGDLTLCPTGQAHLPFSYTWHQKIISRYETHIIILQVTVCQTPCEGHPAGPGIRPPLWPPFADGAIFNVSLSLLCLSHTPKCYRALTSSLAREYKQNFVL